MPPILELPLASGGTVLFEVDQEHPGAKTYRGSGANTVIKAAGETFDSLVGRIRPMVDALAAQLVDLAHVPEQISVEFRIKLMADAGVVIAKAGSEGSLRHHSVLEESRLKPALGRSWQTASRTSISRS